MAIDVEAATKHEAGHAVMQWFVGWENELSHIEMERADEGPRNFQMKATPPAITSGDWETAKKRLLVLMAGAATTDQAEHQYDGLDFRDMLRTLGRLFDGVSQSGEQHLKKEYAVKEPVANDFLQEVKGVCAEIMANATVRKAIEKVSQQLLAAEANTEGICRVFKDEIVMVCEKECGKLRSNNSWLI